MDPARVRPERADPRPRGERAVDRPFPPLAMTPPAEDLEVERADDPPDAPRTSFTCETCGAPTRWDPDADALACEHCGSVRPVPRGEGTIVERALEDAGDAARGLGVARRVARCERCGARVSFEGAATSMACVYCGGPCVLLQEANRNALRPESLVPLDVGRAAVEQSFRRWLSGLWFRPSALRKVGSFDAVGVYVPFWTFDCRVASKWTADAGHYYYVNESYTTMVNGRPTRQTRRVRKTRWVPAWGAREDAYDDLLILASAGQPADLVAELGGFQTEGLVPYRPEYLAGWRAEEYQVDLEQGWERGLAQVEATQRARCAADVPGDTHRALRVRNAVSDVRWKHVLLPIWSLSYRFRGKTYAVLVHGQTGHVVGKAPISWPKVLLLVLALLAVVAAYLALR